MAKKNTKWRITGRARPFSEEEAIIFNHAVKLVSASGKPEAMYVTGPKYGEIADVDIGPFHVDRMILGKNSVERTVQIGITHEGRPVFKASFEQWRRPRRRGEVTIGCAVPTFVRGDWEKAFLGQAIPSLIAVRVREARPVSSDR